MATVIPSIRVYSGDEPGRHSQMGDMRPIPVREKVFTVKHQLTEGGSLPKQIEFMPYPHEAMRRPGLHELRVWDSNNRTGIVGHVAGIDIVLEVLSPKPPEKSILEAADI